MKENLSITSEPIPLIIPDTQKPGADASFLLLNEQFKQTNKQKKIKQQLRFDCL